MPSFTTHPVCAVCPSNKLNKDNITDLELPSHRKFIESASAQVKAPALPAPALKLSSSLPPSSSINSDANAHSNLN